MTVRQPSREDFVGNRVCHHPIYQQWWASLLSRDREANKELIHVTTLSQSPVECLQEENGPMAEERKKERRLFDNLQMI